MSRGPKHTDKVVAELRTMKQHVVAQCLANDDKSCSRVDIVESPSIMACCSTYYSPKAAWRNGDCPMADEHLKTKIDTKTGEKVRVGQQKQKKKSRR